MGIENYATPFILEKWGAIAPPDHLVPIPMLMCMSLIDMKLLYP